MVAELDRAAGAGGLAMARAESASAAWDGSLKSSLAVVPMPRVSLRPLWPTIALTALAFAVPWLPRAELPLRAAPAQALIAPIAQRAEAVIERGLVTPPEAERIAQAVRELEANAKDGLNQSGWDALDRLDQQLRAAQEAAEAKLGAVLAAAAQAQRGESQQSKAGADSAAAELARTMALLVETPKLLPQIPPNAKADLGKLLKAAVVAGAIDPAQAEALRKAMAAELALGEAGEPGEGAALDPQALAQLGAFVEQALNAHRQGLAKGDGEEGDGEGEEGEEGEGEGEGDGDKKGKGKGKGKGKNRGKGGVARGPGHAELNREAYEPVPIGAAERLPPGVRLNQDGSLTIAESVRDPSTDEQVGAAPQAAAGIFDPTAADGKQTTIAPRHRAAVRDYFSTPAK